MKIVVYSQISSLRL